MPWSVAAYIVRTINEGIQLTLIFYIFLSSFSSHHLRSTFTALLSNLNYKVRSEGCGSFRAVVVCTKGFVIWGEQSFLFWGYNLLENDLYNDVQKSRAFSSFGGFYSKSMSLSFSNECCKRKAIKRRESKRVEDTADAALHVTNHNPFSYLGISFSFPD